MGGSGQSSVQKCKASQGNIVRPCRKRGKEERKNGPGAGGGEEGRGEGEEGKREGHGTLVFS